MFTGIAEEKGIIQQCGPTGLIITATHILEDLEVKDSIAVDGVCLTVTELGESNFHVDTIPETVQCTRMASLCPGSQVNLERSVLANKRIGGHIVQGHVEACVKVLSVKEEGTSLSVEIELPAHLRPYVTPKGFVALNGASLTVTKVSDHLFSVALIPYTREHTNLGQVYPGMLLNLETDIMGRYVAQFLRLTQPFDQRVYEPEVSL